MKLVGVRFLLALIAVALLALDVLAGAALGGEFGVANFEAGTCNSDSILEECSYTAPESQFYTQAAGHPALGLTGFELNTEPGTIGKKPVEYVKNVRVDIPPGLSVNPQATCGAGESQIECEGKGQCTQAQFESTTCPLQSLVGTDELDAYVTSELLLKNFGITGTPGAEVEHVSVPMYDLVPPEGIPAEFGLDIQALELKVLIVGGLSWYKEPETTENSGVPTGDYHEFFTIKEVPDTVGIVKTRLKFTGTAGNGTFITLPSVCTTQTSYLHVASGKEPMNFKGYQTLSGYPPKAISVKGCEQVPFAPALFASPGKSEEAPDQPDGVTTDVHVPQSVSAATLNSSDVRNAAVTLPEGLTMNPSAAHNLKACTPQQIKIGNDEAVECPSESQIGTVQIETSMLPPKSLEGNVYLGAPAGLPITGPPYAIYVAAQSKRYGVGVRLQGSISPNPQTGQLTASLENAPALPFEDFILHLHGGPLAPLANPLVCAAQPLSTLAPYTGTAPASVPLSSPFSPSPGGNCVSSAPFSLSQSTQNTNSAAGANTAFTLNLTRADGQQYLSRVATTLAAGLVGPISAVTLCGEPQAQQGTCQAGSQIGTASVTAGSGSEPFPFAGNVYLTGPYNGAPYGLSIVVPANAGPFSLGNDVTRASISVEPYTARLLVTSDLQSVYQGVPLRLRSIQVSVNREKFLTNPTNCGALATETTLTSTFGATQTLSTPFQIGGCGSLTFKPKFSVSTSANTSRADGASLKVRLTAMAGQANIHEVFVELPKQLPARLTTLQKACREAIFSADLSDCPKESKVGQAVAVTPLLPDKLQGPAYLVSHGGAAFPDLEIVLDQVGLKGEVLNPGVRVILDGQTHISTKGITSSRFSAIPDVPISSFELTLPTGRYSALTANGSVCAKRLLMPTTIVGQGGQRIKQNTNISIANCPVLITKEEVDAHTVVITVKIPSAGKLTLSASDLKRETKSLEKAGTFKLKATLSRAALTTLERKGKLKVKLLVSFLSKAGSHSKAKVAVKFKR